MSTGRVEARLVDTVFTMLAGICASVAIESMQYIDNGVLRLGIDLDKGGAVTYLAKAGGPNMVNDFDLGRQIQMSYYSGPIPFEPEGKKAEPFWRGLGWNPIQSGDFFGNHSKILNLRITNTSAYIRCVPMHWPLPDVPGECTFESWINLKGSTVELRQRIVNSRPDKTQYPARAQELPAIYTNGPWHHLITYTGDKPFQGEATTEIPKHDWGKDGPWTSFFSSESWAALVDETGEGLGVWAPDTYTITGGFVGEPGKGGSHDSPTGYMAPNRIEILDHNISYESRCVLIVGSVEAIRSYARSHQKTPIRPSWTFRRDRQHWSMVNAVDGGWPVKGSLNIELDQPDPQLVSPACFFRAEAAPVLVLDASFASGETKGEVFWSRHDAPGFSQERRSSFSIQPDGKRRIYKIRLADNSEYKGSITQLRIDPPGSGKDGDLLKVWSVSLSAS